MCRDYFNYFWYCNIFKLSQKDSRNKKNDFEIFRMSYTFDFMSRLTRGTEQVKQQNVDVDDDLTVSYLW